MEIAPSRSSPPPSAEDDGAASGLRAGAAALAAPLFAALEGLGRYLILMSRAFNLPRDLSPKLYARNLAEQMVRIGIESIPIVALATAFAGGVTTVQAIYQLRNCRCCRCPSSGRSPSSRCCSSSARS